MRRGQRDRAGYDERGNLANKNGVLYQFDYGNRLREVVGQERYRYDGHGRRAQATTAAGSIFSQYSQAGQLLYQEDERIAKDSVYVYLGGSLVATLKLWSGGYAVEYQHTDALGSPVAVTDANRVVIEKSEYEPYGGLLNRPIKDGPGYTGHVSDAATGLSYMQQRYYDSMLAGGRFLSVDPVTATSVGGNFNRYWYANNNPYRFTDPDGRLSRGSGFTDRQWKKFDRAQQSAAKNLEKAAAKITNALATGKGVKGVTRAFERNFGTGSGTAENMTKVASDMSGMAGALRDTSSSAIPANGMTTAQIDAAYGGNNATTLAAVPMSGPTQVIVNTAHADFGSASKLSWAAGHETAHAVFGYRDTLFNGEKGYKFGSPAQRDSFENFPSPQSLTNPDHLMDYAQ